MAVNRLCELIRGGPGSGKTTRLRQTVVEAVEKGGLSPARVLWLALDQPAAQRERDWFVLSSARTGRTLVPVTGTYEDIAGQILRESATHWGRAIIRPLPERLLVGEVIRETTPAARYYQADEVRRSPRFRDDVADFIAELKRCKIDTRTFREDITPGLPHRGALADLADIYERYQQRLREANVYDLRGLIWLALVALTDEQLAGSWRGRYDLIVADDLQDATLLQIELLAALCSPETRLLATHEPAQAIYRFRGAVEDPAALLASLLPDREVVRTQLPAQQPGRMASEVAEIARRFARDWELSSAPLGETDGPGQVEVGVYRTFSEELAGIGDGIIALLCEGELAPDDIAVIVRNHEQAEAAREHLALRGAPVAGQEAVAGAWAARRLVGDLITLLLYVRDCDTYPTAIREQQLAGANLAVWRLASLTGGDELALARERGDCRREGRFMLAGLGEPLGLWAEAVRRAGEVARDEPVAAIRLVLRETGLLPDLAARMPPAMMPALVGLLDSLGEAEKALVEVVGRSLSLEQALSVVEMSSGPAAAPDRAGIQVMIAHDVRGLEFEVVYLVGLSEDTFPAPAVVSRLLPDRTVEALRERVRAHLGIPTATLTFAGWGEAGGEALAEEVRLFYTCLSRARRRLILTCHVEKNGGKVGPSEFLVSALPEDFVLGPTAQQREADFECVFSGLMPQASGGRTTHQGCPVVPCAGRPMLAQEGPAPVEESVPQPEFSGAPILAELAPGWPLSASSLRSYLRCPRQFFFEKLLGLAGEDPGIFLYGTIIHEIMAELNKLSPGVRSRERALDILAAAFARHQDEFDSPYSYRVHYQRAQRALEVYAATEFFSEESLAQEQWFDIELTDDSGQAHRFRGRIDQVVAVGDAVEVIDYKSGKVAARAALRRSFCYRPGERYAEPDQVDYQLPLYALGWEAEGQGRVIRVCLQSLAPDASLRVRVGGRGARAGHPGMSPEPGS